MVGNHFSLTPVAIIIIIIHLPHPGSSSSCSVDITALKWTVYSQKTLTWNEASYFCKERGGYLPVTNNQVSYTALQDTARNWFQTHGQPGDFWMGLHTIQQNVIPNVWAKGCLSLLPGMDYWDTLAGEPDLMETDLCARLNVARYQWRTKNCGRSYSVVCQTDQGNCTYLSHTDKTVTSEPAASAGSVADQASCWELCLSLRVDGQWCVAAVLKSYTACNMYVGTSLVTINDLTTEDSPGSVVMVRDCFAASRDTGMYSGFGMTDASNIPYPATLPCSTVTPATSETCLPPGVQRGASVLTSAPAVVETTQEGTTSTESLTSTAKITTARLTSATAVVETTREGTTTTEPSTSNAEITTAGLTSAIAVVETTQEETTSKQPLTSTPEFITNVTPSNNPTVTKASVAGGQQKLCPCVCKANHPSPVNDTNLTTPSPPPPEEKIPVNTTSRYKRSKTSAMVSRTSYTVLGSTMVAISFSLLAMVALCDLDRLVRWFVRRRIKSSQ